MEIVPTSVLALAVVVAIFLVPLHRVVWVFLALTPFGAAAAFNLPAVGGASIGVMDIGAMAIFAALALSPDGPGRIAGSMRLGQPGFTLLALAFLAVLSAIIFPRLFLGATEVFGISRSDNGSTIVLVPLRPGSGNLTQLFRFLLDVVTFVAMAAILRKWPDPRIVAGALMAATLVHVGLGFADVISVTLGAKEVMDVIRTANYDYLVGLKLGGLTRMVGGFPEASAFGYLSLGLFAFWFRNWLGVRGRRPLILMLASGLVLVLSTSSASYVAVAGFLLLSAGFALISAFRGDVSRRGAMLAGGGLIATFSALLILFAGYQLIDPVSAYLDSVIFDKAASSSGLERMSWNLQAWQNLIDTNMVGAGLGSVRASNWLFACLASFGLLGTALYLTFLGSLARLPGGSDWRERQVCIQALKSSCLAMLISAMLTSATPDLGIFFFAVAGMAAGLSRGAVIESSA